MEPVIFHIKVKFTITHLIDGFIRKNFRRKTIIRVRIIKTIPFTSDLIQHSAQFCLAVRSHTFASGISANTFEVFTGTGFRTVCQTGDSDGCSDGACAV